MQVAIGGIAYLRHVMAQGEGRPVSMEEAEQVWEDLTGPSWPDIRSTPNEHRDVLDRALARATLEVDRRTWRRLQLTHSTLLLSDLPVMLVPAPIPAPIAAENAPQAAPTLFNAGLIAVALDRRTALLLSPPPRSGRRPDQDFTGDDDLPGDDIAEALNEAAALTAERFVYFHPDDTPVPRSVPLPRQPRPGIRITGGLADYANRDKPLEDVLAHIAAGHRSGPGKLVADYTWPIPGYRPGRR